jgi:signal transduction histidine kinase
MNQEISLKKAFSKQLVRWTLWGFAGTAALALILAAYLGVESTESSLVITAQAAAKAFRPMITNNQAQDSEKQIREAFQLGPRESVVVRDEKFRRFYERGAHTPDEITTPTCTVPNKICWHLGSYQVSTLIPIYLDEDKAELKGYLEMNLTPKFDFPLLIGIFLAICAGSIIQGVGLSRRFVRLSSSVGSQLEKWADHVRDNPKSPLTSGNAPFEELKSMHAALAGLHGEISRLETEAQDSAKLSIIRGISHDILSPVSRLQKLLAVWVSNLKAGQAPSPELVEKTRRSLRRLSSIAQQTKILQTHVRSDETLPSLDLDKETEMLVSDFEKDSDLEAKVTFARSHGGRGIFAQIHSDDYLRIVDNLIRNAAIASSPSSPIEVSTCLDGNTPVLVVKDHGRGIAKDIQSKIFDLNFTTRPGSGTGLGLTIVKQLCERNRAQVSFVSQVGVGTEFRVEFEPAFISSEVIV